MGPCIIDLPIVIHCREAFDYIYKVLQPYKNSALTGIFHSFTGTPGEAARMMEFPGFKIGINGVVTFKKVNVAGDIDSLFRWNVSYWKPILLI